MERRTIIIILAILFFVVGIPLIFFIELVNGFGSSSGDYYKFQNADIQIATIEFNSDSSVIQKITNINKIDTNNQNAFYIRFETEFYSNIQSSNSSLQAAHAPGQYGCQEKIDSLSLYVIDEKTNKKINFSDYIELPSNSRLITTESENKYCQMLKVNDSLYQEIYIFENLKDFQNKFNSSKGQLFDFMLYNTPLLFFFNKNFANNLDSSFDLHLFIKMTNGQIINCERKEVLK